MLEPIKRTRLFEIVMERILGLIRDGSLGPGDHLPTERDLAGQLNVSRTSVREALRSLEMMGYVESRVGVGGGTIIRESSPEGGLDPLLKLINTYKKKEYYLQLVEFRIIFETATAKLAARRRDEQDLKEIEESLEIMGSEILEGKIGLAGERKFHNSIAKATHNELLKRFSDMLEEILADNRRTTLAMPGLPQESVDDHRLIFDAIRRGSEKDAVACMKAHLKKGHDKATKGQLDFDL